LAKFGAEVLNSILVVLQDICTTSKLTYSKCPHFFKPNPVVCYYIGTLCYSKKGNTATSVTEVNLSKDYSFMHENLVVSSHHKLFLLLEQTENIIDALEFDSLIYKYGYPNDEVSHPVQNMDLAFTGFFKASIRPGSKSL
jgi:hypothetical protein